MERVLEYTDRIKKVTLLLSPLPSLHHTSLLFNEMGTQQGREVWEGTPLPNKSEPQKRAPILNCRVKGFVMIPVPYFPTFDNKHIKTNPEQIKFWTLWKRNCR